MADDIPDERLKFLDLQNKFYPRVLQRNSRIENRVFATQRRDRMRVKNDSDHFSTQNRANTVYTIRVILSIRLSIGDSSIRASSWSVRAGEACRRETSRNSASSAGRHQRSFTAIIYNRIDRLHVPREIRNNRARSILAWHEDGLINWKPKRDENGRK